MVSRVRNVVVVVVVVVVVLTSTRIIKSVVTGQAPVVITVFVCCFSHSYIQASGQAVVTGVVPSPPPGFLPSMFIAHRVPQSHCSSIFHRVLLTHALARFPRVNLCTRKSPHEFIYEYMHSGGFELTKLTYTRLEDNLIRHRGDRLRVWSPDVQRPFQTKSATSIVTRVCMMLQLLGRDV